MDPLCGSPVVRHEHDNAVLQHGLPPECRHDLAHALVELGHHGRVDPPLGVLYVAELGDLLVGRLKWLVVVAAVGRQVGEVHEHGPGLGPVLLDQPDRLLGEQVRRVLADGVAGEAHVAAHVEAEVALGGAGRGDLVGVVVLQAVPVAEVRVEAAVGRRVLPTVEALVPLAEGVRRVAGVLQVLRAERVRGGWVIGWFFSVCMHV